MRKRGRRSFLRGASLALASALRASGNREFANSSTRLPAKPPETAPRFKLGLVTYQLGQSWDIDTIIKNCEATRFEGSRVRLVSLGSTCEYESPEPSVVKRNIEETRGFCELAHDLGCMGVKVRPNGFPPGSDHAKVLEQIGQALHQCGDIARDHGVEIWLEVHGEETERPPNIHRIMEVCNHPSVGICWNSNDNDIVDGSVKPSFELLQSWLRSCHINELWRTPSPWVASDDDQRAKTTSAGSPQWKKLYPWGELFALFRSAGYDRYTFAEIPASCEPLRLMRYYRALWDYQAA